MDVFIFDDKVYFWATDFLKEEIEGFDKGIDFTDSADELLLYNGSLTAGSKIIIDLFRDIDILEAMISNTCK
jgi:hypothetical protein